MQQNRESLSVTHCAIIFILEFAITLVILDVTFNSPIIIILILEISKQNYIY